jgi:hypothetical protein
MNGGLSADKWQIIRGSSANRISVQPKAIVSVCISAPAEIQPEIYHFSYTGMSFESWAFGAHSAHLKC